MHGNLLIHTVLRATYGTGADAIVVSVVSPLA